MICPLHKKGDQLVCKNYRGITLLNTIYKVLSNVLYERIRPYADKCVGAYQAGFQKGRSIVDQVFTLRQILEKTREHNIGTYHLFIDFKSAYDSVIRSKLYQAMDELQIPPKIIRMVKATMAKVICRVRVQDELSEPFETDRGIRQGDSLACFLFNLALEKAIRQLGVNSRGTILYKSTHLLVYADDIDIIARSVVDLKENFINIEKAAREIGLEINEEKTKVFISITSEKTARRIGQNLTIGDYNFEMVNAFMYLGTNIDNENNVNKEIKRRIMSASKCAHGLSKHLRSHFLSRKTKIKIYRTLIKPVLTYACETWTINKRDEHLLGTFERKILRKIFGGNNIDDVWYRRCNNELYQLYNCHDIVTYIKIQ